MDGPMISIGSLKRDLDAMRFAGFWPTRLECGPLVFEVLINWSVFGQRLRAYGEDAEEHRAAHEERMREELRRGLADMTFNEIPVRLFDDVPDGRFWPSREPGCYMTPPFARREPHNAVKS